MKILVISDTHQHINNVIKLMTVLTDVNRIIHLGDVVGDAEDLESIFGTIPIDYVAGNCDYYDFIVPTEKILTLFGKKILIVHGHLLDVKKSYERIGKEALRREVDAVLFGHTHVPYIGYSDNILLMNPGSISLPRDGRNPSFGILEIDEKGRLHPTLNQIKKF